MNSDLLRMLVQQAAGILGLFGGSSARLMAVVKFLGRITQPDIWQQIWEIVYPSGTPQAAADVRELTNPTRYDPFTFSDEYARLAKEDRERTKTSESPIAGNGPAA